MARPRKLSENSYRTPTYHKPTTRWRLRIERAHGTKTFWWPAAADSTNCPPEIIAAAVAAQHQWRSLCDDWYWINTAMRYAPLGVEIVGE